MDSDSCSPMDADSCKPIKPFLQKCQSLHCLPVVAVAFVILSIFSCKGEVEHTAEAVRPEDSLPFMRSLGISTLISDSGVIRYHLVAEEWDIFTPDDRPATWRFRKGLIMLRMDNKLHVDLWVQADTAWLHEQSLWELRGRVHVRNIEGTVFTTEELFWDLNMHEMWNHQHIHITSPERTLDGYNFRSNESMTRYSVNDSQADFPLTESAEDEQQPTEAEASGENTTKSDQTGGPVRPLDLKHDPNEVKEVNGIKQHHTEIVNPSSTPKTNAPHKRSS